jgi:hypothetical protein
MVDIAAHSGQKKAYRIKKDRKGTEEKDCTSYQCKCKKYFPERNTSDETASATSASKVKEGERPKQQIESTRPRKAY